MKDRQSGFSLVEVVIALGVISVAIIAILGVLPTGLQTSHSSQDETRAAQIAQSVFGSLTSQAIKTDSVGQPILDSNKHTQLNDAAKVQLSSNQTASVDLTTSSTSTAPAFYADNNGQLTQNANDAVYTVTIQTNNSPAGFDAPVGGETFANEVTLVVAWPASAAATNQMKRDFVSIISKY